MPMNKVRDFKYGSDHLIQADMAQRDKSYLFIVVNKLNEVIDELNKEVELRKKTEREFETRVLHAEKKASEKILGDKKVKESVA